MKGYLDRMDNGLPSPPQALDGPWSTRFKSFWFLIGLNCRKLRDQDSISRSTASDEDRVMGSVRSWMWRANQKDDLWMMR